MLQIERDAQYADVMERALYNGVVSGVSLDGDDSSLVNRRDGTIDAAIAIQGGAGSQTVENLGTILGNIDLGAGDDRLVINGERIEFGSI